MYISNVPVFLLGCMLIVGSMIAAFRLFTKDHRPQVIVVSKNREHTSTSPVVIDNRTGRVIR